MAVDLQVIGVGLGRTGTNSLKLALEKLSYMVKLRRRLA